MMKYKFFPNKPGNIDNYNRHLYDEEYNESLDGFKNIKSICVIDDKFN